MNLAVKNPVIMMFDRANVEALNIGPPLGALEKMASTPVATREYGGRVRLIFDGYDDDAREVYQIPEVRRFVNALTDKFPYWFHFADKSDDTLRIILQCLLPQGEVEVVDGVARTSLDTESWNKITMSLFGHMNGLYDTLGLSSTENSETTQQVLQYVRTFLAD